MAKSKPKRRVTVWLGLWHHKHGTDWMIGFTKLTVEKEFAKRMMQDHDFDSDKEEARVKDLFRDGKYGDVIDACDDQNFDQVEIERAVVTR
jgi:hypothetical protein